MLEAESIFQFKLTVTDSRPEIWRRVLVPSDCTLGALHHVILYCFDWYEDRPHQLLVGSRAFGPRDAGRPEREDEDVVRLPEVFDRPGIVAQYCCEKRDRWRVDVAFEGKQGFVPWGSYPCCIHVENAAPPDGVGGISRYNQIVELVDDAQARRALAPGCNEVGWEFDPSYTDIGLTNGQLSLIFPPSDERLLDLYEDLWLRLGGTDQWKALSRRFR